MKVKRFILSVALPLFLAAVILALGTVIPNELLERQKDRVGLQISAVPVSDVRPYGDEYEEMRQSLLTADRVIRNARYGGELTQEQYAQKSEDAMAAFEAFLERWQQTLGDMDQRLMVLDRMVPSMEEYLSNGQMDSDWVLQLTQIDEQYGYAASYCVDSATGIPLRMEINDRINGYLSPWILWNSLTETYQWQSGLSFGEAAVSMEVNGYAWGANDQDKMEEMTFEAAYYEEYTSVRFVAVSTDLTFRLEMTVDSYYAEEWRIGVNLTENLSDELAVSTDTVNN